MSIPSFSFIKQPVSSSSILQFRTNSTKSEKCSVLFVGPSEFCHLMAESFDSFNKKKGGLELTISKSENIEHVLKSPLAPHVDLIVLLMDTSQRYCVEQVERSICLVESVYMCDKIILVNGTNHLSPTEMGMSYDELINLTYKYRIHMFHGNIKNEESRICVVERISNFMNIICGLKTGIPMVLDFPADKFPLDL